MLQRVLNIFKDVEHGLPAELSTLSWRLCCFNQTADPEPPKAPESDSRKLPDDETQKLPKDDSPKLSEIAEDYCNEQLKDGVSIATANGKRTAVGLLTAIIGDKPINQYRREDARQFKSKAVQLPPYALQLLREKSVAEVIEGANEAVSQITVNNYLKNLSTIFIYSKREGYCSKKPFEGLKIKQNKKSNEYRSRYSLDDLKTLFDHIRSDDHYTIKPYRKWLPLLGLYTGARMNELCQLYLDGVIQLDGIHCLHIQAVHPDQRLKNLTSERVIPIHSRLIDHGFLDYVQAERSAGKQRLFSGLVFHTRHNYTHATSRWFSRVRDKAGFNQAHAKKDFHSLRHTVADHSKQLGVAESLISGLLGHQAASITLSRYGKDYKPQKLAEVVELLDFGI